MAMSVLAVDALPQRAQSRRFDSTSPAWEFPGWPVAILAVPILLRAAVFALALLTQSWTANPNRIIPAWAQILEASLMASLAIVLLYYGRADRRAWSLGLFVMDVGATLLEPFVRAIHQPAAIVWLALH